MKNQLENLYEKMLLNEAKEKDLTNVKNNEVGTLKVDQDVFGEKPEVVAGPEKAKVKEGPSYKISTSSETGTTHSSSNKSSFKGNPAPKNQEHDKENEEMEDTKVTPKTEVEKEEEEKSTKKDKYNKQQESFTMSAFETLFKKTLTEELDEEKSELAVTDETSDEVSDMEDTVDEIADEVEDTEEESEDLIADLRELHDKLTSILSKLESEIEDSEDEDGEDEEFSGEDYEEEFGVEDESEKKEVLAKESVDKPKALSDAKGKQLISKKNKVGKLHPKGGKVVGGSVKLEPTPKHFVGKHKALQHPTAKPEVKSTVKKGDFIK